MAIKEKIEDDLRQALKERKETVVSTLRMLCAAIQNAEIAARRREFKDEDVIAIIKQEVKKHKDSILEYKKGGREDLVKKEEQELEILTKYLPPELSEEEIKKVIETKIAELGASDPASPGLGGPADFPKVMGEVMKEVKGRAEGGVVSKMAKEMLEDK